MVEYGSLTSALAVLASALAGLVSAPVASLPTTTAKATALVVTTARAQQVDPATARRVYRRAPLQRPFLRYLYVVGWLSGSKAAAWCALDRTTEAEHVRAAASQIRHDRKVLARLRASHITVAAAAAAVGKGVASACRT